MMQIGSVFPCKINIGDCTFIDPRNTKDYSQQSSIDFCCCGHTGLVQSFADFGFLPSINPLQINNP